MDSASMEITQHLIRECKEKTEMKKQGRPGPSKKEAAMPSNSGGGVLMKRVNFQLPADQHMKLKVYAAQQGKTDRKSTRLNSSHVKISYAVFCLKKKK